MVPDEEGEGDKMTWSADQSEPRELLLVWDEEAEERTDSSQLKAASTPSDSNLSQRVHQEPDADMPQQTQHKQDSKIHHVGSDQLVHMEPIEESKLAQESPNDPTKLETHPTGELTLPSTEESEAQLPLKDKTPPLDSPEAQATSEASNPNDTFIPMLSSSTDEAKNEAPPVASTKVTTTSGPALSSVQPSKATPSVSNPFKIQKVMSSDLKSFQPVLGKDDGTPLQGGQASSLGSGLNLAVPMESLEIISDSEEGDPAAIILPDWLKEGEFVTVGTNKSGTVRYVGPADFAEGIWVGVELEVPAGE